MCGIAGFLQDSSLKDGAAAVAERMARTIAHRGPDDSGVWLDRDAGIALSHRRLSIIDLSPNGRQPIRKAECNSLLAAFPQTMRSKGHKQMRVLDFPAAL